MALRQVNRSDVAPRDLTPIMGLLLSPAFPDLAAIRAMDERALFVAMQAAEPSWCHQRGTNARALSDALEAEFDRRYVYVPLTAAPSGAPASPPVEGRTATRSRRNATRGTVQTMEVAA